MTWQQYVPLQIEVSIIAPRRSEEMAKRSIAFSTSYRHDVGTILRELEEEAGAGRLHDMAKGGCIVIPDTG